MATYSAIVEWTNSGPDFGAGKYGRGHHWTFDGGAVVPASSSPHVVPAPWADPAGVDPEEALVAAASSCHMLWFLHLAREAGLVVQRYFDAAEGVMGRDARGKISMTRITLRPEISFSGRTPNIAEIEALHHEAHERCFIASSLLTEIIVAPSTPAP